MDTWGNYEFFLYAQYKAHWKNGVDMYAKYGQHDLAMNNATVCVSNQDFDFRELIDYYSDKPKNLIAFDRLKRGNPEHRHNPEAHRPNVIPQTFVTSYSNFMKLTSIWKWMDSYANEPALINNEYYYDIVVRNMWQRNMIYSSPKWFWD